MARILQVTKELGLGGIEAVVCGWCNIDILGRIDYNVGVISGFCSGKRTEGGMKPTVECHNKNRGRRGANSGKAR